MNTTTNTRGVSEAMVERMITRYKELEPMDAELAGVTVDCKETRDFCRDLLEAALSAEPAAPCSLNEAMEVMEVWADHGGQVHGEAAARLRALVDRIAPEPAALVECVAEVVTHGSLQYGKLNRDGIPDGTKLYTAPPAQPAERVPEGYALVPAEAGDTDAFMVLHEYQQPGRTRKDAYRIAIRKLSERASEMLAASPAPSEGGKGVEG